MSEINKAVAKLKRARDVLADKIAAEVNGDEDFVENFTATGYRGATADELMELGERFYKLGFLIQAMPFEHATVSNQSSFNDEPILVGAAPQPSWHEFVVAVNRRELSEPADMLVSLLRIDRGLSLRCTAHFAGRLRDDYDATLGQLGRFTNHTIGSTTVALDILRDLFNLQGSLAVTVYQRFKEHA